VKKINLKKEASETKCIKDKCIKVANNLGPRGISIDRRDAGQLGNIAGNILHLVDLAAESDGRRTS
jgi:hypothetical protein